MNTIIGLLPSQQDPIAEVEKLVDAGISKENIFVLTHEKSIREILGCDPICTVRFYAIWGALICGAIYSIFGILAAWCECNLFGFDQTNGVLTLMGGVLAGGFVGAVLGAIIGLGKSEENTHLYTQGARMGNRVLVLRSESRDVENWVSKLRQAGCMGVRLLPNPEVRE